MRESALDLEDAMVRLLLELGGESLLRRLVVLLIELAPQRLEDLQRALAAGDLAAARSAVHALRSTAGTVGATQLMHGCQRIEEAPDLAAARALALALESEWQKLRAGLEPWLAASGDWIEEGSTEAIPNSPG